MTCAETAAIVNGSADPPAELGTAANSVVSIRVHLRIGGRSFEESCTGVRVDERHILTAAHCFNGDAKAALTLSIEAVRPEGTGCSGRGAMATPAANSARLHPQRDLAVITTAASTEARSPICSSAPQVGASAIVAGYGLDESASLGVRRFLTTDITSVSDDAIGVEAPTEAGACVGDSGGPLFVEHAGAWCVAGTLSTGTATCRGLDRYVPLAPVSGWIAGGGGATAPFVGNILDDTQPRASGSGG